MTQDDKDSRVIIDIPQKLYGCSREDYESLGLELLGDAMRFYPEDPPYLRVRLPEGWSFVSEERARSGNGHVVDDRGITRAYINDDHKTYDRHAWTRVLNVGKDAAGQLYGRGASLEDIRFDQLTDEEIEDLVEELERAAEGKDGIDYLYPDHVRRAHEWLRNLAQLSTQPPC